VAFCVPPGATHSGRHDRSGEPKAEAESAATVAATTAIATLPSRSTPRVSAASALRRRARRSHEPVRDRWALHEREERQERQRDEREQAAEQRAPGTISSTRAAGGRSSMPE
jgi:hypothetical protein